MILLSMVLPPSRHDIEYKEVIQSIRAVGQLNPITVERRHNGYRVIDGWRRVLAMKELGETHINANIVDLSAEQSEENIRHLLRRKRLEI